LSWTGWAALAAAGCGPPAGGDLGVDEGGGGVADVEVALSVVPSGVQCVKVSVSVAGQTTTQLLTVAAGASSASLSLGQLGTGSATFNGSAYTLACASVTSSSVAAWIADPLTTTLSTGIVNQVTLNFRSNNAVNANVNFVASAAEIAVGASDTFARMVNGSIMMWGNGLSVFSPLPVVSVATPPVTAVQLSAGGSGFACLRGADGSVWCWGSNGEGQLGPGAVGMTFSATPIRVLASGATDISAGQAHVCAATTQSGVLCWGRNGNGQLGNGTTTASATPVVGLGGFPAGRVVAGFDISCAVSGDGTLFCWGNLPSGQTLTAVPVTQVTGIVDIAMGGSHLCVVRGDGAVFCWGSNVSGQLGDGTLNSRPTPVPVVGVNDAVQVACGLGHTCVRRQGGTVACWGYGPSLGDGTNLTQPAPVPVAGLTGVLNVRSQEGALHTCAETSDHGARCWGSNSQGTLGDGTFQFAPKPTSVKF
jgi:hypothetical protein